MIIQHHFSFQFAQSQCNKWLCQLSTKMAFCKTNSWNQTFSSKIGKDSNQHLLFKFLLAKPLCSTIWTHIYTIELAFASSNLLDRQNYSNKEHIKQFFMTFVVFLTVLTRLVSHHSMLEELYDFLFSVQHKHCLN